MDTEQLIRQHLPTRHIMQLATVNDGQPWLATVHFALDENLNFYWLSMRSTRHSQELSDNPKTAIAIVIDEEKKQCIHAEGEAFELAGSEAEAAHAVYSAAFGGKDAWLEEALSGDPTKRAYYVFKPTLFALFDETRLPEPPRQEWRP